MKEIICIILSFFIILFFFISLFCLIFSSIVKKICKKIMYFFSEGIEVLGNYAFVVGKLRVDASEGTVYKKEIIYGKMRGYFAGYVPTVYRIYITVKEVEISGKIYKCKKYASFDVSEDVYIKYTVGDWFDSLNP